MTDHSDIDELNQLLSRAHVLDDAGWRRVWHLTYQALKPVHPRALSECLARGYSRTDLFTEFFSQKFFLRGALQTLPRIESASALAGWFAHFCSDAARHDRRWKMESLDENDLPAECEHEITLEPAERQAWGIAARQFLHELDVGLRAMVREHLCAPPDVQEPLQAVARRWRIRSYHYRARQLGLTGPKGGFADTYGQSHIGRWMRTLGVPIEGGEQSRMRAALEVLCIEAAARPEQPLEIAA